MPSYEQMAADIIDSNDGDCEAAARECAVHGDRAFRLYLLEIALQAISQKHRSMRRRELRATVIKPDFVTTAHRAGPKIVLSARSKRNLAQAALEFFQDWKIGNNELGDATKADLARYEKIEMASANGHVKNAEFYRTLGRPMNDTEKVKEYWKDEKAAKLILNELWEDKGKPKSGPDDDRPSPPPP